MTQTSLQLTKIMYSFVRVLLRHWPASLLLVMTLNACQPVPHNGAEVTTEDRAPAHVDSIFPIEEEIRRFRAALADSAATLQGGASSRDELVKRFLAALESRNDAALRSLAITPTEFIDLYYPSTRFTQRPYELSPALVWFQLENFGDRGLTRALERYGGGPIRSAGHRCEEPAANEGENRIWSGCIVRIIGPAGDTNGVSLFGPILERDGRFKFISYGNQL